MNQSEHAFRASAPTVLHERSGVEQVSLADVGRSLMTRASLLMATADSAGRLVHASPAFAEFFGRPGDELRGRSVLDLLHPSSRAKVADGLRGVGRGSRDRFSCEIVVARPAGTVAAKVSGIVIHNAAALVTGFVFLLQPAEAPRPAIAADRLVDALDAQLIEGLAAGDSNLQLAAKLHLSRQGVEYRLASLLRRLRAGSRAALVARAYAIGLIVVGVWPPKVVPDYIR